MKIVPFPLNPRLSLSISVTKHAKHSTHRKHDDRFRFAPVISCQKLVIQVVRVSDVDRLVFPLSG